MFWSLGVKQIFRMAKLQLQGLCEQLTSPNSYTVADFPKYGFALPQQILKGNSGLELGQLLWIQMMLMAFRARLKNITLHSWPSLTKNNNARLPLSSSFYHFACRDGFGDSSAQKISTKSLKIWKRGRLWTTHKEIKYDFVLLTGWLLWS